jgi:hypothetical protein
MPFNPIFNKGAAMLKSIFNAAGVAVFAAAMFALPAWSQDGTDGVEDGYYKIHSPDGNYLSYFGAFPNTSQKDRGNIWYIKNLEGGGISIYIGKTKATALELSSNAAEIIRLYASTDGRANQKWLILPNDDGSSRIRTSLNNGRVITDNGTEQLTALTYDNNLNTQKWLFERISDNEAAKHFDTYEIDGVEDGYYKIHSPAGNYLSYSGVSPNTSKENWGNIWYIKNLEGGGISIYIGKTKATALELSSNAAEIIRLYTSTDGRANQKWLILPNYDGSSRIRTSLSSARVITDNGTEQLAALTYEYDNLNTQKWLFERISDYEAAKHFDTYEIDKVEDGYYKIHSPGGNYLSHSGVSLNTLREDQKNGDNIWYVKNLADGGISIRVSTKMTALELISNAAEGIRLYASDDGRANQKWLILPNYDSSSQIRTSLSSGRVITDNGTEQLTALAYDNLNTQKWVFERISDDKVDDGRYKINSYTLNTDYDVTNSIDNGSDYLSPSARHPIITTVLGSDGSINVCSVDNASQTVYVYEYSSDMKLKKTLRFNNEYDKFGAFAKDSEGNYYLFFARDLQESDKVDDNMFPLITNDNNENMIVVKYNSKGEKIKSHIINQSGLLYDNDVKIPLRAGACRMEISGDMLAVHFAKVKFMTSDSMSHQESYGFILNKNDLAPLQYAMPNVSHSFNQYILPIEDGFLFGDKGDGNPRAFFFYRMLIDKRYTDSKYTYWNETSWNSFRFKGEFGSNPTFAQFGGVEQTSKGYIFAGCSEKNNIRSDARHNDARNLLLLTFYRNDSTRLNFISDPLWITNYPDKEQNAANPKIVNLGDGKYLIMWEYMTSNQYISTLMQLVDENGAILSDEIKLAARLNVNDVVRYDKASGNIYWAVNNGKREIVIYSLNVQKATPILSPKIATGNRIITPMRNGINLTAKANATIAVYSISGKLVSKQSYNAGSHSISFGHLPKGMYIVRASFGNANEVLRVAVR